MIFKCYRINGGDSWEVHLADRDEYFGSEDTLKISEGSTWEHAFDDAALVLDRLGPVLAATRDEHAKLMAKIAAKAKRKRRRPLKKRAPL